ncbi:MAG: hypothetical protein PHE68_00580 [Candidatus Peribacteraceae bacterium]|nr:hypothetical protein [Candidatus Peribacteraceae bacterium]MDD5075379.1 hypothetical protein [Candidatus Peribacteraceae bacterium]
MTQMPTLPRVSVPSFREILRRAALPFAVFGIVLLLLLVLSWVLLLPRFTRVELHGMLQNADDLQAYVQEVKTEIGKVERKRDALILPLDGSSYGALAQTKVEMQSLPAMHAAITGTARSVVPEQSDAIALTSVRYDDSSRSIEVGGDVRNVGLRSMTVLAELVDAFGALPFVAHAEHPSFTREKDPDIGYHSPFQFRLMLK